MSITYPARTRYNQTHKHAVLNRRTRITIPYTQKEAEVKTHSPYAVQQIVRELCADQNRQVPVYVASGECWLETNVIYTMKEVNELVASYMYDAPRLLNPAQS